MKRPAASRKRPRCPQRTVEIDAYLVIRTEEACSAARQHGNKLFSKHHRDVCVHVHTPCLEASLVACPSHHHRRAFSKRLGRVHQSIKGIVHQDCNRRIRKGQFGPRLTKMQERANTRTKIFFKSEHERTTSDFFGKNIRACIQCDHFHKIRIHFARSL